MTKQNDQELNNRKTCCNFTEPYICWCALFMLSCKFIFTGKGHKTNKVKWFWWSIQKVFLLFVLWTLIFQFFSNHYTLQNLTVNHKCRFIVSKIRHILYDLIWPPNTLCKYNNIYDFILICKCVHVSSILSNLE